MVVMSTQLIGFSIGVWPANLVTCALFNTLHSQTYAGISRERFFFYAWFGGLLWYLVPGYLFQGISYFSWVCWIAPENIVVNQTSGYVSGLGMSMVTFDWSQIAYIGWAEANIAVSFVFFFWLVVPSLYYTNAWESKYMPISSRTSDDNTAASYNISHISDASLNLTAYEEYSPLFLSTTFAISYALSFASITATLMHAFLFFRKQIWVQSRLLMFVIGVISIELWHTEFPVWAFVLSLTIAFFYVIPIGMVQAITNQQVGLNVITELVVGYALPGKPIAMMMFKTWGYITMYQALTFSSDFKLGHYMKIPPRTMLWGQVVATAIAGTVQLGVQAWMFTNIPDICNPTQKDGFICPNIEVFGTASFVWGVIGPQRQFPSGQIYHDLVYFLIGAFCPAVAWLISLKWSNDFIRYVNFPVIFSGMGAIPPASALNYVPWAIVGFIFQYVIRRKHFSWWTKYNYVLSAAMDSGLAVSIILIFFCLEYPDNGSIGLHTIQTWWGNTVFSKTADGQYTALWTVPEGSTFG
ncbi:OPT oligopeptide transporter protein-domain-containing protein [Suillus discolor]|uniref:OPT oligopeptide transporter protein-domain-containing protein n=1 Tax=Suillus discolor TaxID=1912936 RepID=A0A9P7EU60_9AGAM|nr:OPT oligopeptide transporter protein-domain-containing protein [Suillus discolor]KAG2088568.1 OPT oligopeptide transporter protein-domain-containing protein [Suillus discolor]